MIVTERIVSEETFFCVEALHGSTWTDMPGFTKDSEDEAREGALVLKPLCDDVRLVKVTMVTGMRREELEL